MKFSRDFYNLHTEEKTPNSALEHYLDASVRSSQLPREVLSWYNNVHWASLLLEDLSFGKPAISPALHDLRRYMYTLVKERGHMTVTEYGRTSTKNFQVVKVRSFVPRLIISHLTLEEREHALPFFRGRGTGR